MVDCRLIGTPLRTGTDPTMQEQRRAENKLATSSGCYHHSTSYLFHQSIGTAMIKSCMLQLITAPCYDAEVMTACLSANSVRRPSQSKKLRTLTGLGNKSADGGLDIVAYLNVFSYRVPRRKEEACCSRQHFNHAHPMTYSHQTSSPQTAWF